MNIKYDGPDYKCSKCGSLNRFFMRMDHCGRSYKECADCGHDDRIPDWNSSGAFSSRDMPKIVEF